MQAEMTFSFFNIILNLDVIQELCFLSLNLLYSYSCAGAACMFSYFYVHTSGGALSSCSSSSSLWVVSLVQNILVWVSTKKWGCHCYNTLPNVCIQIDTTKKSHDLFSSPFKGFFYTSIYLKFLKKIRCSIYYFKKKLHILVSNEFGIIMYDTITW